MSTLEIGKHKVTLNGSTVECDSEEFDLTFDDRSHKTLHVDPKNGRSFELMSCQEERSGSLFMDHLYVPDSHKGQNFGKLGVAFFYLLLEDRGYRKFSIKFGSGESSAGFLSSLGFDSRHIHVKKDVDYSGSSVMVGDLTETGSRSYDWSLGPIPVSNFPTGFFNIP